jgi:hypothetical protein
MNTQGILLELLEPSAGTHKVAHLSQRDFPFPPLSLYLSRVQPPGHLGWPFCPRVAYTAFHSRIDEQRGKRRRRHGSLLLSSPLLSEGMQERMVKGKTEEEGGGGRERVRSCGATFCLTSLLRQTKKSGFVTAHA